MDIQILQLIEGAKQARGLTVIIDVFRAFSVACYVISQGANAIIPIGNIEDAYKLKDDYPDYILIGERHGMKPAGFDFGNSAAEIEGINFAGKTIIHTTSAGTQGIVNAVNADKIITGSLVNIRAIVNYIKYANPETVSLVCMGLGGNEESSEDTICAEYIKSLLENTEYDIESKIDGLKYLSGMRFFDPANFSWSPERDFYLCTDVSRFDFVLKFFINAHGTRILRKI